MSATDKYNLTEGSIFKKLLLVAVPIIGTSVIQMAYNLTDMFWLGRLDAAVSSTSGSQAVAASGTVGMFMWLSMAFMAFGSRGAEIGVAQNIGKGDHAGAQGYGETAVTLAAILGVLYGGLLIAFRRSWLGFFALTDPVVEQAALSYLVIIGFGLPFAFVSGAITGIFNGSGNSRLPFYVNAVGLVLNMLVDPLLIIRFNMGIEGAAIATVGAQFVAFLLMALSLTHNRQRPFDGFKLFARMARDKLRQIVKWVWPISVESFLFTFLSMIITRFVTAYGTPALTTQRVGSQVESLSWLIAGGFAMALTAYVGQNYGAGKWNRIQRGFKLATGAMVVWGIVVTAVLYFSATGIFSVFIPNEPDVVAVGANYLRILSSCQLIACLEGIASGSFRGMGRTKPPSIVSVTCNALRVVAAWLLSTYTPLGLDGIWWAISIGAGVRGLWMYLWYVTQVRKMPADDGAVQAQ